MAGTASCCSPGFLLFTKPPQIPFQQHLPKAPSISIIKTNNNNNKLRVVSVKGIFGTSSSNAGVLERPSFDQSQFDDPFTQVEQGGDMGRLKAKKGTGSGDSYRVLLIDDATHTEKLVAKVLPQVVPSVTPDAARELFHKSRENGTAVVIVAVKEHAEFYAQMMAHKGLRSTIEPDSDTL
ncbi:hypothetical protein ACFE04_029291 [Oxalis oulophora]